MFEIFHDKKISSWCEDSFPAPPTESETELNRYIPPIVTSPVDPEQVRTCAPQRSLENGEKRWLQRSDEHSAPPSCPGSPRALTWK